MSELSTALRRLLTRPFRTLLITFIIAIGIGGALVLASTLRSLLFEVTPADPISYAIVAALLLAVALAASWIPTRHAIRVDPAIALRTE